MTEIKISGTILDIAHCLAKAQDDQCGASAVFIGTVRNRTGEKEVVRLEFECYEAMAVKELQKIADHVILSYGVSNMVIHHRTGILYPGDTAVVIVAAAPHRAPALEACRFAIDTLKQTVPIWKKEVFEDGETWVAAHP